MSTDLPAHGGRTTSSGILPEPQRPRRVQFPYQGSGPFKKRPERLLLVCWYNPGGISTVPENVAYLQYFSDFPITVLNTFEHSYRPGPHQLAPSVDFDEFAGIIIHNTVTYNSENLFWIDAHTKRKLKQYDGVKVLMKQDDNHEFRQVAHHLLETGYDLIFTCLPPEAVPQIYPVGLMPATRFERMLTGYVTPTLRALPHGRDDRPIDIGYRGSIQPLSFGRLAYEKRRIGAMIARALSGRDLRLDISSRWEDRLGGDSWFAFLRACKATLGTQSGASVFDLHGDLAARIEVIEAELGPYRDEEDYAEAYLSKLSDLEDLIAYGQLSPRHFEAAATGTVQILYPGQYSGVLTEGRHFVPLMPDGSNIEEALAQILDAPRRSEIADAAFEEVILDRANWIETFVARVDGLIEEAGREKGSISRTSRCAPAAAGHTLLLSPRAGACPSPSVGQVDWAPQTHRIVIAGAEDPVHEGVDDGPIDWSVRRVPWRADQALAWIDPLACEPGAIAVIQELQFLDALLRLPPDQFGALLAASPDDARREDCRSWMRDVLDTTATLTLAGSRLRGVRGMIAEGFESLPAAIILGALFGAPVEYRATEPEADAAADRPEFDRQFRAGLVDRIAGHLARIPARLAPDGLRPGAAASPLLVIRDPQAPSTSPETVRTLDRRAVDGAARQPEECRPEPPELKAEKPGARAPFLKIWRRR